MSVERVVSGLRECRYRFSELRGCPDCLPLRSAILRQEGDGFDARLDSPFVRVWPDRLFLAGQMIFSSDDNPFGVAFCAESGNPPLDRLGPALAALEPLAGETQLLVDQVRECDGGRLVLPPGRTWWRTLFHLAWHFPRPFCRARRDRLLTEDGANYARVDETIVQLDGTAGRNDLIPGMIYGELEHDVCTSSEAAIDAVIEVLERQAQATSLVQHPLSSEQRHGFDQLRDEFLSASRSVVPSRDNHTLLKLVDSFSTPPATGWAGVRLGGAQQQFMVLSRLNEMQEVLQVRGPATRWFCELAERAGAALPAGVIHDHPILFDEYRAVAGALVSVGGIRPVVNRGPLERWVGFVFATLMHHRQEALQVRWGTPSSWLSYGFATLDMDLFAASALALDLAGLTSRPTPAGSCNRVSGHESTPCDADLGGWEILGDADAAASGLAGCPEPSAGRLVIAREPPTRDGYAEARGMRWYIPRRDLLALVWESPNGRTVLQPTDGHLVFGGQGDAAWLPEGWDIGVFPANWGLDHLEGWFAYAIESAGIKGSPGLAASAHTPTPRELVAHAHLIVRHLALAGSPAEPRVAMDPAGCLAELRDVLAFFRRAMPAAGEQAGSGAQAGESRSRPRGTEDDADEPAPLPAWVGEHFQRNQYQLIRLLWGQGEVPIATAYRAIYGRQPGMKEALDKVKDRVNARLAEISRPFEVVTRRGEVYVLRPIDPGRDN